MSSPVSFKLSIQNLLTRFFRAFDDKNWPELRDCLCDEVFIDYSSFRREPASRISADRYVERRRGALRGLDVQHSFLNLRVQLDAAGKTATARCNYIVHRFHASFDRLNGRYFHSCGRCDFVFAIVGGDWKISRITQNLMPNTTAARSTAHGASRMPAFK